jgi:CRISPR/Cas system-associated exonuclease Cas4 (RecB family)
VYDDALVYTNPVSESVLYSLNSARGNSEPIVNNILNEPDHYFVASEESMLIKETFALDTLKNAQRDFFTARSVVKTYYLQINVKGAEYVTSASGYITGLAGSVYLADRRLNEEDESSIYFQLKSNHTTKRTEVSQAYCTFNTFGKIPDADGKLIVVFVFKTTYGTVQVEEIELNDLFETDMVKNEQWIIIDKIIEIKTEVKVEDLVNSMKFQSMENEKILREIGLKYLNLVIQLSCKHMVQYLEVFKERKMVNYYKHLNSFKEILRNNNRLMLNVWKEIANNKNVNKKNSENEDSNNNNIIQKEGTKQEEEKTIKVDDEHKQ